MKIFKCKECGTLFGWKSDSLTCVVCENYGDKGDTEEIPTLGREQIDAILEVALHTSGIQKFFDQGVCDAKAYAAFKMGVILGTKMGYTFLDERLDGPQFSEAIDALRVPHSEDDAVAYDVESQYPNTMTPESGSEIRGEPQ